MCVGFVCLSSSFKVKKIGFDLLDEEEKVNVFELESRVSFSFRALGMKN